MFLNRQVGTVTALGVTQTLAWASSYYLPAVLATPMARDLGVATPTVFAAVSVALVVSAFLGPTSGRAIDRWGGRPVLMATNVVFALGLTGLGLAQGPLSLFAAWLVLGIGMGSGLYEAAFATLVRIYGTHSRGVITGITLIAGFASTVGWPLSALLETHIGWRGACFSWALIHLAIGMPLNWSLPRANPLVQHIDLHPVVDDSSCNASGSHTKTAVVLAFVFAVTWFISTAMAAHLPRVLQANGATLATAVAVGALIGPSQVLARVAEFSFLRHVHPLLSARLAALMHPVGAAVLTFAGAPAAAAFVVFHGAGNGILTIAKGTLPLVLFGPRGYGHRQGLLMVPARTAQALAPWLFGVLLEQWGARVVWFSAALSLSAFVALFLVQTPSARASSSISPTGASS